MKPFAMGVALAALAAGSAMAADDRAVVAELDRQYQAAIKANDAETLARIHHPDMVLIGGQGNIRTGKQLEETARSKAITYEIQDEEPGTQTVRVFGDTAVVTAKLRLKYTHRGETHDRTVWFSDTYVRTSAGWRYAVGQASLPQPKG